MTPSLDPDRYEPTREDVLVGRVVDGEASVNDWDALESIARTDPAVWERVARAQRTHARLEREVEDAIALAELINIPSARSAAAVATTFRLRTYGGWAAAAAIALAWVGLQRPPAASPIVAPQGIASDTLASITSLPPEQLLDHYVNAGSREGRVLGQMQPMLVEARDLGEGRGKEVWYVRPILERTTVTDLSVLDVQMDEHGTPRYVPLPVTPVRRQLQPNAPDKKDPRPSNADTL